MCYYDSSLFKKIVRKKINEHAIESRLPRALRAWHQINSVTYEVAEYRRFDPRSLQQVVGLSYTRAKVKGSKETGCFFLPHRRAANAVPVRS
jgi:hypothetical protein